MALKRPRGTNDFLGDKVKLMTKLFVRVLV